MPQVQFTEKMVDDTVFTNKFNSEQWIRLQIRVAAIRQSGVNTPAVQPTAQRKMILKTVEILHVVQRQELSNMDEVADVARWDVGQVRAIQTRIRPSRCHSTSTRSLAFPWQ